MIQVVLASKNPKKKKELEALLADLTPQVSLFTLDEIGEIPDVDETGSTFLENASKKAREIALHTKRYALADDSGLCVDALGGKPGVYSARYAGEPSDSERNNGKLLDALKSTPQEKRTAHFVCVLALASPEGKIQLTAEGRCNGFILDHLQGEGGFGYDPLFFFPPLKKSFAQLTSEEKGRVSHRGLALQEFQVKLRAFLSQQK